MIKIIGTPYSQDIIIGGGKKFKKPKYVGPNLPKWLKDKAGYYTNATKQLVNLEYTARNGVSIKIYQVQTEHQTLIKDTLDLVPPSHLSWFNKHKKEGIILANSAGRNSYKSYTGGLNASYDDASTPFFNEKNGIIITNGAIWEFFKYGIAPTILHEIGHVMTKQGKISYRHFSEKSKARLKGKRVSRNNGSLEALCNAYMYFLCYASKNSKVRTFGTRPENIQKNASTRRALRKCPAFSKMLDATWVNRFHER